MPAATITNIFNGDLKPDFLRRGLNDVIYSIHAPGLPALLISAYTVAGYRGAVVMLCLFAAVAALAIFELATLIAGPAAAIVAWASVCLTVPFVPHAWLIFPEIPGAMLVAGAALWLYAPESKRLGVWVFRGAGLGLLPWLHTKFVILLAALLGALVLRLWRRPRVLAALVAPIAISVALWILSFYVSTARSIPRSRTEISHGCSCSPPTFPVVCSGCCLIKSSVSCRTRRSI